MDIKSQMDDYGLEVACETPFVLLKRLDMFACAALTGLLADGEGFSGTYKNAAHDAYKYAEAMENEREKCFYETCLKKEEEEEA